MKLWGKGYQQFSNVIYERPLKARCNMRFRRAFTECCFVFKVITLFGYCQRNYFENATACSERTLKTCVATCPLSNNVFLWQDRPLQNCWKPALKSLNTPNVKSCLQVQTSLNFRPTKVLVTLWILKRNILIKR